MAGVVAACLAFWVVVAAGRGAFENDRFLNPVMYALTLALLAGVLLAVAIVPAAMAFEPEEVDLSQMNFAEVFVLHALLALFLTAWYFLTGRPAIADFLSLPLRGWREGMRSVALGLAVGFGGWILTIGVAVAIATGLLLFRIPIPSSEAPPIISWLVELSMPRKLLILLSAMTVEEAFFRGFLQRRFGIVFSTLCFALAHLSYGQPLMLAGIATISIVLAFAYRQTRDLLCCAVAHGTFDAIQLFVVVPFALRKMADSG